MIEKKLNDLVEKFNTLKNTPKPKPPGAAGAKRPNNMFNFGGGAGESSFYENLRKQYNMSEDATYDEIMDLWMEKSGNRFESGPPPPKNEDKKENADQSEE